MKNRIYVLGIFGFLFLVYSFTLVPPLLVSWWYHDGEGSDFLITFIALFATGYLLWAPFRRKIGELRRRDGFLIVAVFWILLSLVSALPFAYGLHVNFVDSLFEATSGFTTTGSTIFKDLEELPPSILYYRQQLQFLGGMGLIVFAIAILPVLGVGGTQLYRAETPGPIKDTKLTPRLSQSIRTLSIIYIGLMIACAIAYWLAGLTPLEALEHSYTTVSTGGFSTHNNSLGYFHSHAVNFIAVIFMMLGAINFSIHYMVISNRNASLYFRDSEVRTYILLIVALVIFYSAFLYYSHQYRDFYDSFETSLFEVTSVITSTGFGITDFTIWPFCLPVLLIFISFIGGCGGSTAGGIKVIRVLTLMKQAAHEAFMLVYPKSKNKVKIGRHVLDDRLMQAIWGFFAVYIVIFVILTLLMMINGLDQVSAFAAVASAMNNLGPGLGQVSMTFADVSTNVKLIAIFAMLLGRLEIFTLLVILTPEFWRN